MGPTADGAQLDVGIERDCAAHSQPTELPEQIKYLDSSTVPVTQDERAHETSDGGPEAYVPDSYRPPKMG